MMTLEYLRISLGGGFIHLVCRVLQLPPSLAVCSSALMISTTCATCALLVPLVHCPRPVSKFTLRPDLLQGHKGGKVKRSPRRLYINVPQTMAQCSFSYYNSLFFMKDRNKKNHSSVHSLKLLTNAKIHIFNYVPHQNKRNVYFIKSL